MSAQRKPTSFRAMLGSAILIPLAIYAGTYLLRVRPLTVWTSITEIAQPEKSAAVSVSDEMEPPPAREGTCDGDIERDIGSIRKGESVFSERIQQNPNDGEALLARGIWRLMKARIEHTAGEDGLSDLAAALLLLPNDVRVPKARGTFLAETGQDALPDLSAAIRLDPNDSELFLARAEALSNECGGCDEALRDASRAVELDVNNADSYYRRACIWGARNNAAEEMKDLSSAIAIDPAHTKSLSHRSERLASRGEFEAAVNDLSRIIESNKDRDDVLWALFRRGEFRRTLGQWNGAISDWSEILREDPDHSCLLSRSLLLSGCPDPELRDGKKALVDAMHAAKGGGSNPEVLEAIAAAHAELGDFEKAQLTQNEAVDAFTVRTIASDDARVDAQLRRMEARAESYSHGKPLRFRSIRK